MSPIVIIEEIQTLKRYAAKFGADDSLTIMSERHLLGYLGVKFDPEPLSGMTESDVKKAQGSKSC